MKTILFLSAGFLLIATGCARFATTQRDLIYDATTGAPVQAKTTKASSYTLFSSKSSLASWKASQTDKTQGATVGDLNQQGATNAAGIAAAIAEGATAAALKAIK